MKAKQSADKVYKQCSNSQQIDTQCTTNATQSLQTTVTQI